MHPETNKAIVLEMADALLRSWWTVVAGVCLAPDPITPLSAMTKEVELRFVLAYEKDDFQYTVDMMEQERIAPAPMITDRVGLDGVAAAFDQLAAADAQCKVIIRPG